MATQVTTSFAFLLKAGLIFCAVIYCTEGLPQSDVQFPDFGRDPNPIRLCQQQGVRNCPPGGGNPQSPQPSLTGHACRSTGLTIQQRLLLTGSSSAKGCGLMQGNVMWPGDASKCARVLSQGPCPQGQWVILSNEIAGGSICAALPCVSKDQVLMNGQCYHVNDKMCPPTMTLQTNEFGNGECDCPVGTIYHQDTERCYTPYSQGPCNQGFIIKVVDLADRGTTQCVRNPCPDQNMAPLDQQCRVAAKTSTPSQCHQINKKGPCSNGILSIDGTSAEPGCSDRTIFSGFGVPCRRGSMRDQRGRCRRIFNAKALSQRPLNQQIRRPGQQNQRPGQQNQRPGQQNQRPGQQNQRPGQQNQRPGQQNQRPRLQNQRCNENQLLLGGVCITKG